MGERIYCDIYRGTDYDTGDDVDWGCCGLDLVVSVTNDEIANAFLELIGVEILSGIMLVIVLVIIDKFVKKD